MAEFQIHAMRVCSKCGLEKPLNEDNFHTKKGGSTGRLYFRNRCKPCQSHQQRTANQRYYGANREKMLAQNKAWQAANPEYEASRWPRRREKSSEYKKNQWAEMNPEQRSGHRQKIEAWKAENPDKARAIEIRRLERIRSNTELRANATNRARAWRDKNPEAAAAARDRRRAREVGAEGSYCKSDVLALLKSQGRICFYCSGFLAKFECDHFIPLARGGSNWPSNLRLACSHCNASKGAKLPWEWKPEQFSPP